MAERNSGRRGKQEDKTKEDKTKDDKQTEDKPKEDDKTKAEAPSTKEDDEDFETPAGTAKDSQGTTKLLRDNKAKKKQRRSPSRSQKMKVAGDQD